MYTARPSRILSATILTLASLASAVSLSGKVVNQDAGATGKSGVTVTLVGSNLSTTTDAQGAWSLNGTVGVSPSIEFARPLSGHLTLDQGYLRLAFQGRDLGGRKHGPSGASIGQPRLAASRTQAGPELLAYSINGKIFLQDTVWNLTQSGMTRVFDTTINPAITYGYIKDDRDGQTYRTVVIGSQVWMAQNLNYVQDSTNSLWYYGGDQTFSDNPTKDSVNENIWHGSRFGRLYNYRAATNSYFCLASDSGCEFTKIQGACPLGWHVPHDTEWNILEHFAESDPRVGVNNAGRALKSVYGWRANDTAAGMDVFGFHGLPTGSAAYYDYALYSGSFGKSTAFWSASYQNDDGKFRQLVYEDTIIDKIGYIQKGTFLSVRCLSD